MDLFFNREFSRNLQKHHTYCQIKSYEKYNSSHKRGLTFLTVELF